MKNKYKVVDGRRMYICVYKNCRKFALNNAKLCKEHYGIVNELTPIQMEPTWFSKFVQGLAEFISWIFGR